MQKSEYSTEIITVFCMSDLRGRKCVFADLHYSVFRTWAWVQLHVCEEESADKTFKDQAVFQEDWLLALLTCVCMRVRAYEGQPLPDAAKHSINSRYTGQKAWRMARCLSLAVWLSMG